MNDHWNASVTQLAGQVITLFEELDEDLVQRCAKQNETDILEQQEATTRRQQQWDRIDEIAMKNKALKRQKA